jgi:hypothetical protein
VVMGATPSYMLTLVLNSIHHFSSLFGAFIGLGFQRKMRNKAQRIENTLGPVGDLPDGKLRSNPNFFLL